MRAADETGAGTLDEVRQTLSARLRERLPVIEEAIFNRVRTISTPPASPAYLRGLRSALQEAVEYVLEGIETGEAALASIPPAARTQARLAARTGIPVDTVLRRYHAGDRLMAQFILEEAEDLPSGAVQQILGTQNPQIDHLTAEVSTEYMREVDRLGASPSRRLRERIELLLEGDADEDPNLRYEFNAWHVGIIGVGKAAETGIRQLAKGLDCQLLLVPADDGDPVWGWLGRRRTLPLEEIERSVRDAEWTGPLAVGEPRRQIDGWRLTHREAQIALRGMQDRPHRLTRARDVILIAAVLQDPFIAMSLCETYVAPLEGARGDYKGTLRAYFEADGNAATAAAALGRSRHTVERRLRRVEELLGQNLASCDAQLQVALCVDEFLFREKSAAVRDIDTGPDRAKTMRELTPDEVRPADTENVGLENPK